MILTGAIFMMIYLDMSLSVTFKHKNVTLTPNKENVIASPGYPNEKYERDTIYTWDVTAPPTTEIIFINVNINIHKFRGPCEDYLKIQEINRFTGNFTLFQQCGALTANRTARGNRLLITLVSNNDNLTSSGFQLRLKVLKMGTTSTTTTASTPSTTTIHVATKARTTASTLKTTAVPLTTITAAKVQTSSTTTPSTTTQSTTTTSTTTTSTTTPSTTTTSTTTPSTTTTSTTTPSTTTTSTTTPSTTTTSTTAPSTTTTTTSTPNLTTPATSLTTPPTTKTKMTPNTTATTSIKSMSLLTSTTETSASRTLNGNVILLIGLGVLEVTLIVIGVLAVQRYRRKRKFHPSRQSRKRNDDHTNTLKRQNSCGETHVYDEIDIDNVKEEEEESQYKELPEGVYDTTLKRRSHLKVVGERKSYYSRGSIINMFRTSSFFRRKVNETSVMTFSSFKGPIQSQIGEKK